MEDGAVVEAGPGILEKVGNCDRCLLGVKFQFDVAESGADDDHADSLLVRVESAAMIRAFPGQENTSGTR
jgi:hypothetical protein